MPGGASRRALRSATSLMPQRMADESGGRYGPAGALDLEHDALGEAAQDEQILLAPVARLVIDRAQRAERVAVAVDQRHARVGDDVELLDRQVAERDRALARVGDDQRAAG